ncbi:class I SAM-dependent RNA methyltransferase [Naasia lichenicola]|uniref:Class I SAM-dependent RNA methyltransferase n=1 Tax=Naasia lichenicola TaxID=2565933 RepID=A0A4S4FKA3_9MICO|nr:TRAM domain-containing protein [Naasia lichenicola]THG30853.1 class I SAM-dependent RNA methyltransferase [Naasia lichenicola]
MPHAPRPADGPGSTGNGSGGGSGRASNGGSGGGPGSSSGGSPAGSGRSSHGRGKPRGKAPSGRRPGGSAADAPRGGARPKSPAGPPSPEIGREVEVEITGVAHGGVFVARSEGRVVFVSDALPGERVVARISDASHDRFWRAEAVRVLDASADRQDHIWSVAGIDRDPDDRAGGAEFGHIRIDRQRLLKEQVLVENLQRMAGLAVDGDGGSGSDSGGSDSGGPDIDTTVRAIEGAEDGTGWRTRVRLHVGDDGTIGPYAARSHRVIPVTDLPLAAPELAEVAPFGRAQPDIDGIDLVLPSLGSASVAALRAGRRSDPSGVIVERVGGREFRLARSGFWQVHRSAAQTLTTAVREAIDDQLFDAGAQNLDLYGGVGLLAAAVGDRFGSATKIETVESDESATAFAQENLADWIGATAVTARVDRYLAGVLRTADNARRSRLRRGTVVLDPPRSGAGGAVVDQLVELRPAQIVYVACDPVALARDIGGFRRKGYELVRLRAFDLFPNTHHVEAVATLVPA